MAVVGVGVLHGVSHVIEPDGGSGPTVAFNSGFPTGDHLVLEKVFGRGTHDLLGERGIEPHYGLEELDEDRRYARG